MSRSKKNRLTRLLASLELLHSEKLGKRGRTKMSICRHPKGYNVAILQKKEDAMFRDGLPLNVAAKEGRLCWMLDDAVIPGLASREVEFVIFYQDITEDIYVSRLVDWQDEEKRYRPQNPNALSFDRHSISVRHMSLRHMKRSLGNPSQIIR